MTSLKDIVMGQKLAPPRLLIHGVAGVGKTTFGAGCDNPIFIQTEDGADVVGAERFPLVDSFDQVNEQVAVLLNEDHNYQTVVIDSLDWLEPLVVKHVLDAHKATSISKIGGFGDGYLAIRNEFRDLLNKLGTLRTTKKMVVVLLAHTQIKEFNDPNSDSYDRYMIKLGKQPAAICMENSDLVGFANYRTTLRETGKNQIKAIGSGERVLYTQERPSWIAKSRYPIAHEIEFSWKALQEEISNTTRR
tara:strand:- start:5913 stop:6653 length:741 start_codon:yes stop_codon:yes gene_type:complete